MGTFIFEAYNCPPVCGGNFYDSGGPDGTYSDNELSSWTIFPDNAGDVVTVLFTFVDIETAAGAGTLGGCWDYLAIYDGPNTDAPLIAASLCGRADGTQPSVPENFLQIGDSFTSSHPSGALTFVFVSDGSVTLGGWVAEVICESSVTFDCPDLEADNGDPCSLEGADGIVIDCECALYDCAMIPGGTSEEDECGVCLLDGPLNPEWNTSCADCAGVPNGTSEEDECGVCLLDGPLNPDWNTSCADCAGVPNGTSEEDECGVCLLDGPLNPAWNTSCADCAGVPNGPGDIDECGVCIADGPTSPVWNASCTDCAGVVNGTAYIDNCGDCVGGTTGLDECEADCFGVLGGEGIFDDCGVCRLPGDPDFNSTCTDCAGVVNGTAFVDNCGDCVGGTTGEVACVADCAGVFGGTAFIDDCGDCVGGTTGEDACVQDCAGVFGGTAFIDDCGDCVGGTTGLNACAEDCAGVFGGSAFIDECGDCVGGTTGLEACVQDCAGVFGGNAEIDDCGVCIAGGPSSPNWNASCTDCAGVLNGTAFIDNCGDCVGGTTGLEACLADCLGVLGGDAEVDECGVCYANGPANPNWNSTCTDCAGVVNGTAFIDNCGDCVGGTTGLTACVADCLGVFGGNAAIDQCGDCWANGPNNPNWNLACTDCAGVVNGTSEIDECGDCILDGPNNPLWGAACAGETFQLTGVIMTENGDPVPNATASLGNNTATTNAGGFFSLGVLEGSNGQVTAMKDINPRNGVTTFDLVLIQRHILQVQALATPYQKIAGDVNNNGQLDVGDILMIQQLILFYVNDFLDPFTGVKLNNSWKMVKPGVNDPNPNSSVVPSFESAYTVTDLSGDMTGFDFVAIKMGDVNSSATANAMAPPANTDWRSPWIWTTHDRYVSAGEEVRIDIRSKDYAAFEGFQVAIQTQGIHLTNIESGSLNAWSERSYHLIDNETALISWIHTGAAQQKNDVLFTIIGQAKAGGMLSQMLAIETDLLHPQAYEANQQPSGIAIDFLATASGNTGIHLLGSYPNPFSDYATITFSADKEETVDITIYDLNGRVIVFDKLSVTPGNNQWTWSPDSNVPAGYYMFRVQSELTTLQGRLIYMD